MEGKSTGGTFGWYSELVPRACPPKSLFVILFLLVLGSAVPTAGLLLLGYDQGTDWLPLLVLLLLLGLVFDVFTTYRRYRTWGGECLCGECRSVFSPALI
jgi:hypothetical protein